LQLYLVYGFPLRPHRGGDKLPSVSMRLRVSPEHRAYLCVYFVHDAGAPAIGILSLCLSVSFPFDYSRRQKFDIPSPKYRDSVSNHASTTWPLALALLPIRSGTMIGGE